MTRKLTSAQEEQLDVVTAAAFEGGAAENRLHREIRRARKQKISLERIAAAAGLSREKVRVLVGEATYQKKG